MYSVLIFRMAHRRIMPGEPRVCAKPLRAWAASRCTTATSRIRLAADGTALDLSVRSAGATVAAGQAGLATVRVECALESARAVSAPTEIVVVVRTPKRPCFWKPPRCGC